LVPHASIADLCISYTMRARIQNFKEDRAAYELLMQQLASTRTNRGGVRERQEVDGEMDDESVDVCPSDLLDQYRDSCQERQRQRMQLLEEKKILQKEARKKTAAALKMTKSLVAATRANTYIDVGSLAVLHEDILFRILKYFEIHELYGYLLLVNKAFYSLVTHMNFDEYVVDFRKAMRVKKNRNQTAFFKILNTIKNKEEITQLVVGDFKFTDSTWAKLVTACPNLTHLTFVGTGKLAITNFKELKDMKLQYLKQNMDNLKEADYLELIRNTGESLQHVEIGSSVRDMVVTDQLLTTIATKCSNLLSLKWNGSFRITDVGITALLNGCKKLHTVELKSHVCSNSYWDKYPHLLQVYNSGISTISTDVKTMLTNAVKNVVIDLREPQPLM